MTEIEKERLKSYNELTDDQLKSVPGMIEDYMRLSKMETDEQNAIELAKMNEEIARQQGDPNLFSLPQLTPAAYAPMSTAERNLEGSSSLLSNAYDVASFLPRLAITGYRELGDAATGLAMGAVGGENYYTPNVAKRMSGEDSNVFFDELGNPINYIPAIGGERLIGKATGEIAKKLPAKIGKFAAKNPKTVASVKGLVTGAAEGASAEFLNGLVEENATGKTDRSPLGGAAFGSLIGGGLGYSSQKLKELGEKQVLSEIKIPGRTEKGANAPDVKNLLEYPVEYLPENQKPDNFTKAQNWVMRKLTGDETIGTTRNLTGGEVSDILDRVNEITNGLVDERAMDVKKIAAGGGYVNLDLVIDDVAKSVQKSRKFDIAEKAAILDELNNFRDTELATLADMQSLGEYKSSQSYDPIETGPFDFILDARERTRERAKFETIKDPRRDKPIADMYADLYRGINDKIFAPQKKIIHDGENISINHNIADEDIAAFAKTQEGLKRMVPFEVELPSRSTVANGRQIVGLPALVGAGVGTPIGGVVGSVAGPAGTVAGSLGGAEIGAGVGTALTRGTTAGKVMYETGKAIGSKRLLPKIVTPTASRIANEPFRTTYYRDEDGNIVETQTNKPLPSYKDVASLPKLADSTIKKLK